MTSRIEGGAVPSLVEVRNLGFTYQAVEERRARPFALEDVSLTIGRGEIFGLIGPNSAGKTTLLRLLTRVLEPARGDIALDGRPLAALRRSELARLVAVVPQEAPRPFPFTVEQLVLMGRYPHTPDRFFETEADLAAAREAMAATGVLELARLPLERLSGGERQRAMLARAVAQRPRLLVLDEPTSHLDLRYQAETAALLARLNREGGVTVLVVTHDLRFAAELCDRLALLADGRVARAGSPRDVLDARLLETVFGCAVVVDTSPTTGRPLVQVAWPAAGRR